MARNPEVKIKITSDVKDAQKGLKEVEGSTGGLIDKIGGIGGAAAIGGGALAAFVAKGIGDFKDLGIEVGKLHDTTGIAYEDASRLIEVFGDLGISAEDVQGSISKMEKKLGANQAAFQKYGVTVQHTKDGQVDANATFLNAIDALNAMEDPNKRAAAGADIFGKSWGNMAEVIAQNGDQLRTNLAAVSDAKIFDEKKVNDARDLREAFDTVKDAGEDLFLTIGKSLAPVIAKLAPTLAKVVDAAGPLVDALGEALGPVLETVGEIIDGLMPVIQGLAKALAGVGKAIAWALDSKIHDGVASVAERFDALQKSAEATGLTADEFKKRFDEAAGQIVRTGDTTKDLNAALDVLEGNMGAVDTATLNAQNTTQGYSYALQDVQKSTEDAQAATEAYKRNNASMVTDVTRDLTRIQHKWEEIQGTLSDDQAWLDLQDQFDNVKQKAQEAWDAAASGAEDAETKGRDYQRALDQLKSDVIDYGTKVLGLPDEQLTKIYAAVNPQSLDEAEALLANLTRNRNANIFIQAHSGAGYNDTGGPSFDTGGIVKAPLGAPVRATVHGGEMVLTPEQQKAIGTGGGGGMTVVVNVAGHVITERDLARTVTAWIIDAQRRGEIPAQVIAA